MMKKWDDVSLLCEPLPRDYRHRESASRKNYKSFVKPVLGVAVVCLLVVTVVVPFIHFHRELPPPRDSVETGRSYYRFVGHGDVGGGGRKHPKEIISQVLTDEERVLAFEKALASAEAFKEQVEEYFEDASDAEDEQASLLETVGEDPADPDAVAFLLPLRGPDGILGIKYGRRMKHVLEQYIDEAQKNNPDEAPISSVLVRDSQGIAEVARKLTSHFYEIHGTTRYFGYLTDDEAMEVAHWARSKAPGTRYVTPTATTTYLENAKNIARVQPSARVLGAAVADLLVSLRVSKPLVVVRASLHTDSFLAILRTAGVKPAHMFHYYESTNMTRLLGHLNDQLSKTQAPVLLLGDIESFSLVEQADDLFPATWILPFPTQIGETKFLFQSELLTFIFRPFDDKPGSFLKEEPMLNPVEAIVAASKALLTGKQRSWRGVYVVAAAVPAESVKENVKILGETKGWNPLLQYEIVSKTQFKKRVYQQLVINPEVVKPLGSGSDCRLILTYIEELTGEKKVEEMLLDDTLPTVVLPAERGAQVHVDCPQQHADLRCAAPKDEWAPVKCQGTLQGQHQFMTSCGRDISMSIPASKGCVANRSFNCTLPPSLGCLLADLCSAVTHARPFSDCTGMHVEGK